MTNQNWGRSGRWQMLGGGGGLGPCYRTVDTKQLQICLQRLPPILWKHIRMHRYYSARGASAIFGNKEQVTNDENESRRCTHYRKVKSAEPYGHKVRTYKEYHSVALRRNWDSPPTPFSPASVPLPPETGGRGHTSLRVGGWGGVPIPTKGYTVVLFICTYFVHTVLCERREELAWTLIFL